VLGVPRVPDVACRLFMAGGRGARPTGDAEPNRDPAHPTSPAARAPRTSWARTPAIAGFWPAMTESRRRAVTGDPLFPWGEGQGRIAASTARRRGRLVPSVAEARW